LLGKDAGPLLVKEGPGWNKVKFSFFRKVEGKDIRLAMSYHLQTPTGMWLSAGFYDKGKGTALLSYFVQELDKDGAMIGMVAANSETKFKLEIKDFMPQARPAGPLVFEVPAGVTLELRNVKILVKEVKEKK